MKFYETIAPYYDLIFPHNAVKTDFALSFVHKTPAKILDVGCATGSFCMDLSGRGNRTTGVDLDKNLISLAEEKARREDQAVNFQVRSMLNLREAFGSENFDLITCVGNTLVHLQTLSEMEDFFNSVHDLLSADGALILQTVNYDKVLAGNMTELPTIENDRIQFIRNYQFYEKRIGFKTKLQDKVNNRYIENEVELYPLRSDELKSLLQITGFDRIQLFGNFKKDPFTGSSPAMIGVAFKAV